MKYKLDYVNSPNYMTEAKRQIWFDFLLSTMFLTITLSRFIGMIERLFL